MMKAWLKLRGYLSAPTLPIAAVLAGVLVATGAGAATLLTTSAPIHQHVKADLLGVTGTTGAAGSSESSSAGLGTDATGSTGTSGSGDGSSSSPGSGTTTTTTATHGLIKRITSGNVPRGVTFADGHLWALNWMNSAVVEIDTTTGAVVSTFDLPRDMGAQGIFATDGNSLWFGTGGTVMQRFDVATHVIDETIDTADYGNNGGVNAMTIVDGHLWLTTPQASVLELNAATGEYLRTVNLPDIDANISGQRASAIAGDSNSIWVADLNAYDRIDQNSGTLLQTTDASSGEIAQPYAIADDGTNVWMTLQASNQVLELDARTGAVVQTIALPSDASNPRDIASDGKTVAVVTQEGQLILIDASAGVISGDFGSGGNFNDGVGVINGCAWMAINSYAANDSQESGNQIAEFCP